MAALLYLIDTLLSLAQLCFLLRLLLQWARADFRNPLLRAIVQLTSPVLVPLRRLLPAIGRLDTASVLVVIVLELLRVSMPGLLSGRGLPPLLLWAEIAAIQIVRLVLVDLFLWDFSLRDVVVHRAGHLFTRAGVADFSVRAGTTALSQAYPAAGEPRSVTAVGRNSHSGAANSSALDTRASAAQLPIWPEV